MGGVSNRNLFPRGSEGQKSKVKVLIGLVSSEGLFPWIVDGCLDVLYCLYLSVHDLISSSFNAIGLEPTLVTK